MEKQRNRIYTWENPLQIASKATNLSGFEFIKALYEGEIPPAPILNTLDFKISNLEKGNVIFEFSPQEFHYNPIGSVHGGAITTILDSAIGCSLHSFLAKKAAYTTLDLKINFIRKITENTGVLKTNTKIIHLGKSTALIESDLLDNSGEIYAHAVSTCMIFQL